MFDVLVYQLKRPFHLVKTGLLEGLKSELHYRYPAKKLKIICVTGTDGKTTSSTLLYKVLQQAGKKVALLSTVAAYIGQDEIDTGFHVTTPSPKNLQHFMKRMVDEEYEYLVLEATSQGIYQHRLWGITPMMVGITNITMEHLDYHLTHDLYVRAKALLAEKAATTIINADDELSFGKLKRVLHGKTKILTYSNADELPPLVAKTISARFPEPYNQMNARLVYALSQQIHVEDKDFVAAVKNFSGVPGRMETVSDEKDDITVIVDFGHTPNALDEVLTTLRTRRAASGSKKSRIIAVFGCAGLRDWKKRPAMGQIAARLADYAVFTAEDPRTENVWSIIRQMKQGLETEHNKCVSIADRKEAITFAITALAKPNDTVILFGKGHEKSMCYGTTEYPWSDTTAAQQALLARREQKK